MKVKFSFHRKKLNKEFFLFIALTACFVFLNGSTVELLYGNRLIPSVLLLFVALFFLRKNYSAVQLYNLIVLALILFCYSLNFIIYENQCWGKNQVFVNFLMLICAFFFAESITYSKFKEYFIRIMCAVALFSLVMYFGGVLFSWDQYAVHHDRIYLFGLHNYWAFSVGRNSGPFWEPGAFQIFLNLAILFQIEKKSTDQIFSWKKFFLLSVAVLSTFSTSGYIILFVLVGRLIQISIHQISNKTTRFFIRFLYISAIPFAVLLLLNSKPIQDKFFEYNGSTNMRLNDLIGSMELISEIPLYGVGINTKLKDIVLMQKGIVYNSVGIFASTINYGIPYMVFYLCCVGKNISKHLGKERLLLLFFLIAVSFSQSIFEYPIMFIFLFRFKSEHTKNASELQGNKLFYNRPGGLNV